MVSVGYAYVQRVGGVLAWSSQVWRGYGSMRVRAPHRPPSRLGTAHSSLESRVDRGRVDRPLVQPGTGTSLVIRCCSSP